MATETVEDLVTDFLLRDEPLDVAQERHAMETVARILLAEKVPPNYAALVEAGGGTLGDWACYTLAHWLLDGEITVKPVRFNRDWAIALHVHRRTEKSEKWEAAVAATMEEYGVKRATVARACAKHSAHFARTRRSKREG